MSIKRPSRHSDEDISEEEIDTALKLIVDLFEKNRTEPVAAVIAMVSLIKSLQSRGIVEIHDLDFDEVGEDPIEAKKTDKERMN